MVFLGSCKTSAKWNFEFKMETGLIWQINKITYSWDQNLDGFAYILYGERKSLVYCILATSQNNPPHVYVLKRNLRCSKNTLPPIRAPVRPIIDLRKPMQILSTVLANTGRWRFPCPMVIHQAHTAHVKLSRSQLIVKLKTRPLKRRCGIQGSLAGVTEESITVRNNGCYRQN